MALSSFGKILTVLDLFSTARPVINVDTISEELGLSKPTSYRYLKELVSAELLQRMSGTSGDYTLGPKIAVLDFISRTTDPLVTISIPFMKKIAERTEFCCLLTQLNQDSCIDVHHEIFKDTPLLSSCTNLSLYLLACVTCVGVQRIASVVSSPGFLPSALPSG